MQRRHAASGVAHLESNEIFCRSRFITNLEKRLRNGKKLAAVEPVHSNGFFLALRLGFQTHDLLGAYFGSPFVSRCHGVNENPS